MDESCHIFGSMNSAAWLGRGAGESSQAHRANNLWEEQICLAQKEGFEAAMRLFHQKCGRARMRRNEGVVWAESCSGDFGTILSGFFDIRCQALVLPLH